MEDNGASLRDRATAASQSSPQAVSSIAGIPSADMYEPLQDAWVLDATMGIRDGLFAFCPAEGMETGETYEITSIVTGMNILSALPPGKLIAIVHEDGQDAVEAFVAENEAALDALAQAIEARRAETRSGSVADESAVGTADAPNPHGENQRG